MATPSALEQPPAFLEVLVDEDGLTPPLVALCAGFELKVWRAKQFAAHLFEWLPEFALTWSERQRFTDVTSVRLMRRAAQVVYDTDQYKRRGEFGELLLHAIVRQVFASEPAISKLFHKDSSNNTIKGFDCVHVVSDNSALELWLGEVKFYDNISTAISHVVTELKEHTDVDYLRDEFALILNKIDPAWPHAEALKQLLDPNISLDKIFDAVCIPVLLTYDSSTVGSAGASSIEYREAFREEVLGHRDTFASKELPNVKIHLLLVPLGSKKALVDELHKRLKSWQNI
jgi:hypothetical protein